MEFSAENSCKELLIGCGNSRKKLFSSCDSTEWQNLYTLDIDESCKPDIVYDLNKVTLPFDDDFFDSIHAYDVLEHTGQQGDYQFFFDQFSEFWRILKPDGSFCGLVPHWCSVWAFGDPGHRRVINAESLMYLSQLEYDKQVGKCQMTDYRHIYKADFSIELAEYKADKIIFILKALKEK